MKTERNGDSLGTSTPSTFVSSPLWAELSATVNTSQKTMKLDAVSINPYAIATFPSAVRPPYWDAEFATLQALPPQAQVEPLLHYPAWKDQEYRRAYLSASIEQGIAWQIRANRKGRGLSQDDLALALDTQQSAISRLEDPEYGAQSLETLVSLANVFDCALSVRFIPYSVLARESQDLSAEAMFATSFEEDISRLVPTNELNQTSIP